MNDKQENKLGMFIRLESRLDNNLTIVNTKPALVTAHTSLKNQISNIRATDLIATNIITGVAQDKKALRQQLNETCFLLSSTLAAYAGNTNNNTLYQEVYLPVSSIELMRDDQISTYAQLLHDRANTHVANLADYGITPASVSDFQALINSYTATSQKPRTAISDRKTAVANLKTQFTDTNNWIKRVLDKLIIPLKPDYPDFVTQYFNDRIIIDDGAHSANVTVSGVLTSNADGTPIVGATIQIGPYTFTSAADGSFSKSFYISKPTTYNTVITATGFQTINTSYQFTPNVNQTQDLQMSPSAPVATGTLSGTVSDVGTAMVISGASISVVAPGINLTTNTDPMGIYNLGGIPAGTYTVTVSAAGYIGQSVSVTINANSNTIQNFNLVPIP
jgi:hypothetical protein